ncbi:DUF6340 family protein [Dysgonomonas sp. OttesenSCG-928-M03]|nr:DUF6340 family protein [Dysgonomonas sp. OttesenSCG-928-M03]
MKKFSLLATILFTIMFCTSCTSVNTIVVNVQKPAQITLPNTIDNIGIVNNAIPQPALWGHTNYKYTKKGERIDEAVEVASDSICYIFTETLFELLSDSETFKNVSLYEYPLREDLSFQEEKPTDSLAINKLSHILNADAIISLDRFLVGTAQHEEPYDFDMKFGSLDLKMEARFRIYSKQGELLTSPLYFTDSIYWTEIYTNDKHLLSDDSIPNREEALKQASVYAAEKIAKAFSPSWIDEPRIYYGDDKPANNFVKENNWTAALSSWENAYNKEQKVKKKARLANNIALAYELSDDIRNALKWAQISVQLFTESAETSVDQNNLSIANSYYNELQNRYKDFKIMDIRKEKEAE